MRLRVSGEGAPGTARDYPLNVDYCFLMCFGVLVVWVNEKHIFSELLQDICRAQNYIYGES